MIFCTAIKLNKILSLLNLCILALPLTVFADTHLPPINSVQDWDDAQAAHWNDNDLCQKSGGKIEPMSPSGAKCVCPDGSKPFVLGESINKSIQGCNQNQKTENESSTQENKDADAVCKAVDSKAKVGSIKEMTVKKGKYLKCTCEGNENTFSFESNSKNPLDEGFVKKHEAEGGVLHDLKTKNPKLGSNPLFEEFGADIISNVEWGKDNDTTQCDPERQKKAMEAAEERQAAAKADEAKKEEATQKEKESKAYKPPGKEPKSEEKPFAEEEKEPTHGPKPEDKEPETTPGTEEKPESPPSNEPAPAETPEEPEKQPTAKEKQESQCKALGATSDHWADQCICKGGGFHFKISTESTNSCAVEIKERQERSAAEEKQREDERQKEQRENEKKKAEEEKIQKLCEAKGLEVNYSAKRCLCGNNYEFDPNKRTGCPSTQQKASYWWNKYKNLPDGLFYFPPRSSGSGGGSSRSWKWPSFKLPKIDPSGGWMN